MFLERFQCFDLQKRMYDLFDSIPELETGEDGFVHLLNILGMLKPEQLAKGERLVLKQVADTGSKAK